MASSSILSASRTATFTSLKSAASTKSILKRASRPTPLPLSPSPFPFTASFSIKVSASARSPHVHFPPSPLLYSTFSAASFDLSSSLSPSLPASANVLEPPASAEPTTSPLMSPAFAPIGFKLLDPPKPKRKPAVHFQDPRSPRPSLMASLSAAALTLGTEPTTELGKALMAYPRSPYPSAPLSPERTGVMYELCSDDAQQQPRAGLKRRNTADNAILTTRNGGTGSSAVTFQLTSSRRLAPPHLDLSAAMVQPPNNSLSPVREIQIDLTGDSVDDAIFSATPESTGLSDAFWESVSIEDGALASAAAGEEGSDAGFPESVTGSQVSDSEDAASFLNTHDHEHSLVPRSPMPAPALLFGDSDGALWSPGMPREQDQARFTKGSFLGVKRSTFTAPSPKDPLARFPTFALALQRVAPTSSMDNIKLPPRAHLV